MNDGEIRINTKIDTSGIDSGIDEMQTKLTHSIKGLSSIMKGVGATAAFAALSKAIQNVSQETSALENSIRKASTLFGDVNVDVDNLRKRIQTLSSETGIAADEIGNALYDALSASVPATEDMGDAMDFMASSVQAAKGGFADLSSVVTATASIMNAYGMSVKEADRVQGVLMQTQNKGITTIGQLSTTIARVIPTAASFGVSLEEVGAALATATAAGTQTAQAVTGLNSLLSELGKEGQTGATGLKEAAAAAGLGERNFQELIAEGYSLSEILTMMQEYAESCGLSLIDMFGSIEAGRAALQLAGENAERYNRNLEAMYSTSGLVSSAYEKVTTNAERLGIALQNASSTIGTKFEPAVQKAAGILADMVNSLFNNRDEAGRLETALGNVESALDGYRTAQEQARRATDETTQAMAAQSEAALLARVAELGTALAQASASMEKNARNIRQQNSIIEEMDGKLDDLARQAGMTREEMDRLGEAGILDDRFISEWRSYDNQLDKSTAKVKELTGNYEELESQMDSCLQAIAEMYANGNTQIMEALNATNTEAASKVSRLARAYTAGKAAAKEYGEVTAENMAATEEYISALEAELEEVEAGSSRYSRLKGEIDALTEAYNQLAIATGKPLYGATASPVSSTSSNKASGSGSADSSYAEVIEEWNKAIKDNVTLSKVLGENFDLVTKQINATESAIESLIKEFDLNEESEEVQYLAGVMEALKEYLPTEEMEEVADSAKTADDVFAEWNKTIGDNVTLSKVMGDDYDLISSQISATESAIRSLVESFGMDEGSEMVQYLSGTLEYLREIQELSSTKVSITVEGVVGDWAEELDSIDRLGAVLGDEFDVIREKISATESAIKSLVTNLGLDETSDEVKQLKEELEGLQSALTARNKDTVLDDLAETLETNSRLAEAFGDDFDEAEEAVDAYRAAIAQLISEFDLDPASEEIQELIELMREAEEEAEDATDGFQNLGEAMLSWAESAATSFAQDIGGSISDLVTDLMTIDEQVAELEEDLLDAKEDLLDANEDLAEAEEEYRLALLSGNDEAIADALEQLQLAKEIQQARQKEVSSIEDEIAATQSGQAAWSDFGKAALEALADVLYGLGAQLAAQAIAALFSPTSWGNAAIAAAGSAAAFVAAGLVSGWAGSYAEGGIVPKVAGVPDTGDRLVANVNPGELILNAAQQDNLASVLSTQTAMIEAREAERESGGGSLYVEVSGDVYGLNSEEVGRAIYRNIRSLQEKGRIDRWR